MMIARTLHMCELVQVRFFFATHLLGGQLGLVPTIFWQLPEPYSNKGADYAYPKEMPQPTFKPFRQAWGVSEKRTFVTTTDSLRL